jgi:SpoVK/Ycf46/Vps4 family AAA+-type ATPase
MQSKGAERVFLKSQTQSLFCRSFGIKTGRGRSSHGGEAERQLKLLFEEAARLQPSIIFFDEIDGLAPVRSSRQDQIHNSIVSTLLALMDGLDPRGRVVRAHSPNLCTN